MSDAAIDEINELRKENAELKEKLKKYQEAFEYLFNNVGCKYPCKGTELITCQRSCEQLSHARKILGD